MKLYLSLLTAFAVTYALRAVPMLLLRKPLKNRFLRSFLYYVPYVTLSVMVFPEIVTHTGNLWIGAAVFAIGCVLAWCFENLFLTAAGVCVATFLLTWLFGGGL